MGFPSENQAAIYKKKKKKKIMDNRKIKAVRKQDIYV